MKLISIFICLISFAALSAKADLLKDCNSVSSEINKGAPKIVDRTTTLSTSVCRKDNEGVVLSYLFKINAPSGSIAQKDINGLKPGMLQGWCTNPQTRIAMNRYVIEYIYTDAGGQYIGKIKLTNKEC